MSDANVRIPEEARDRLAALSLFFNGNAVDLGVWWGCGGHDDLQGFCWPTGWLWWSWPVGVPGQEAGHLALRLTDHGPEPAGWVDLFL